MVTHNFGDGVVLFRVTCWMFVTLQLTYFLPFTFQIKLCINLSNCLSCSRVQFPCNSLFLMQLLIWMWQPLIGPSIFRVLGYICLWMASGQDPMCRVHIAIQELQAVSLMLCTMPYQLSGKVEGSCLLVRYWHYKSFFYNQSGTASLFLSILACHILNLSDKHGITLYSNIHSYPTQCRSQLPFMG